MKTKKKKIDISSYMFLLPAMLIYLSVIIFPTIYTLVLSLFKWNGSKEKTFVGLQNYITLFTTDPVFKTAIKNNLIWIILTVVVTVTISLGIAVLLNQQFKGRTFFRGLFYFPCIVAPIVVAIIWRWVYNTNFGFVNEFFELLGINYRQAWLSDVNVSIFFVFIAGLWAGIGQPMLLFLAGLQGVSPDALEAAKIDGATGLKRFIYVTVPLLKETFVIVLATQIVAALKVYDIIKGLTDGGPSNSTQMLSTYMYNQTFQYNNFGLGSAIAIVMVVIMMVVIVPYVSFSAKED